MGGGGAEGLRLGDGKLGRVSDERSRRAAGRRRHSAECGEAGLWHPRAAELQGRGDAQRRQGTQRTALGAGGRGQGGDSRLVVGLRSGGRTSCSVRQSSSLVSCCFCSCTPLALGSSSSFAAAAAAPAAAAAESWALSLLLLGSIFMAWHPPCKGGWIQHSTTGHAASVVLARKASGMWSI
jgi:hypothetical protein